VGLGLEYFFVKLRERCLHSDGVGDCASIGAYIAI
jgi:hypothetical protein